jgi:hypothetical protein
VRFQFVKLRKSVYRTGKIISTATKNTAGKGNSIRRFRSVKPDCIIKDLIEGHVVTGYRQKNPGHSGIRQPE